MAFSPRNIIGCFLKKRLTKGGSRAPQDPPRYALDLGICCVSVYRQDRYRSRDAKHTKRQKTISQCYITNPPKTIVFVTCRDPMIIVAYYFHHLSDTLNLKSASRYALGQLCKYSPDYSQNCTPLNPITITNTLLYVSPFRCSQLKATCFFFFFLFFN